MTFKASVKGKQSVKVHQYNEKNMLKLRPTRNANMTFVTKVPGLDSQKLYSK